jgi:hypothetical protein
MEGREVLVEDRVVEQEEADTGDWRGIRRAQV